MKYLKNYPMNTKKGKQQREGGGGRGDVGKKVEEEKEDEAGEVVE